MKAVSRYLLIVFIVLILSQFSVITSQSSEIPTIIASEEFSFDSYFNQSDIEELTPNEVELNEVTHYIGEVEIFPDTSAVSVNIDISYVLPANIDFIRLNHHILSWTSEFANPYMKESLSSYPNGFNPMTLTYNAVEVQGIAVNYTLHDSYIHLNLDSTLAFGASVTIHVEFDATIPESQRRLAKMVEPTGEEMFSLPHLIPLVAVFENGNYITNPFDEVGESFYSESSYFKIEVIAPNDFVVGATGTMISTTNVGSSSISTFEAFPVRDWIVVGSYDYVKETTTVSLNSHDVSIHSLYLSTNPVFEYQGEFAGRAIEFFSNIFGDYAYTDYTSVQTLAFYGGMEYPMLSLINGTTDKERMDSVSAHEVGHQWNWVMLGNNQATEGWLDEGITTYFQNLYDLTYGNGDSDYIQQRQAILIDTLDEFDIHINMSIYEPKEDLDRSIWYFAAYTYMSQVMHDLHRTLGNDILNSIMKNYYHQYRFELVKASYFINQFVTDLGQSWPSVYFDQFLNNGALPLVGGEVKVVYFTADETMLEFNITATEDIPQRLKLIALYEDENEEEFQIINSAVFNGNTTFRWKVPQSAIKRVQIGFNGGALSDFDKSNFFGSILYRGIEETTLPTTELISSTSETSVFTIFPVNAILITLVCSILRVKEFRQGRQECH